MPSSALQSYIDLTAAVKLGDKVTLRLGVNNVFDKDPPIIGASTLPGPPAGNGNTFPQVYDSLGTVHLRPNHCAVLRRLNGEGGEINSDLSPAGLRLTA